MVPVQFQSQQYHLRTSSAWSLLSQCHCQQSFPVWRTKCTENFVWHGCCKLKHKILLFLYIKLQDNQRWFRMTHYNVQLILRTKHAKRLKIIYGSKLPEKKISSILGEYLTSYLCTFYFAFFFSKAHLSIYLPSWLP